MFSLFKKFFGQKPALQPIDTESDIKGNPAKGAQLRLAVQGPAGERQEEVDLIQILSTVLFDMNRHHTADAKTIVDSESGVSFRPGVVSFQPNDDLSINLSTTIEIAHPKLAAHPFFEYQHSRGQTAVIAAQEGFKSWAEVDLPVVLD